MQLTPDALRYRFYDDVDRLQKKCLHVGNSIIDQNEYFYNAGSQRTQQVFTAGNFLKYTYDDIGQLKTATGWEATARLRACRNSSGVPMMRMEPEPQDQ